MKFSDKIIFLTGYIAVGHLMHIVYRTVEGKNILRSNFWLGDIKKDYEGINCIPAFIINNLGNTWLFRRVRANYGIVLGLYRHCFEEMTCLSTFLNHYYTTTTDNFQVTIDGVDDKQDESPKDQT